MDDISYYAAVDIDLSDIEKCAQSVGYRCQSSMRTHPVLNISFEYEQNGVHADGYCLWAHPDHFSDSAKRAKIIQKVGIDPMMEFWITYHISELPQLMPLLKAALRSYGGCVEVNFSYAFFTVDNIDDLYRRYKRHLRRSANG